MKVIVNADDLGFSRGVNDAIFSLMARGRVTSATIMANGADVEDAVRRAGEFPRCSFGVHLNAFGLRPLTQNAGLSPILDQAGNFAGNVIRQMAIPAPLREAIFQEWCAQVDKLQSLGLRVSHFDSHHHTHTLPALLPVLKRLQRRFNIRKVRISMNIYSRQTPARSPWLPAGKAIWNFALRHFPATTTTEGFSSLQVFCEAWRESPRQFGSVELMVHPGAAHFEAETKLLDSPWWEELSLSSQFISYHEL
jgi:predicted glycoside hydrolase/deacetylase ChbG (UPF0249 family)